MYKKTKAVKVSASHSRKTKLKIGIIAIGAVLVAVISSVTVAFIIDETVPEKNTLNPALVACEVQETFENNVKSNVIVKNTGEVESYIRAKVVITWMSADESMVTANKPQADKDYTITYTKNTAWKLGADGYWYYTLPVDVGNATEELISSCSLADGAAVPGGFYLSVEVVGSAIQSTPTKAVTEKWSGGVESVFDRLLVLKQGGAE